ncbi:regulator of Vps4 activity in the MVB pathway-domain-containing protein [Thelonectria olida]|uniref:Regulator of Vps4 activity in the MVB pathway-domain-containing protein n=1 Tax=Thelonectria olida TaxID=1576542 RepID=A0A9P9ATR9_9HYPO|nr:regulator of Vps4 activity in the MVB pathway-domain-containing protein [Thelonectria olida]
MPPAGASLVTKLKVQLKLAIARLRMVQQRDEQLGKANRRAMAQLLEAGKVDSARIRVENIIRADIISELHEILELYCELLLARAGLMEGYVCDPGLEEAIKSLLYAAPKTEIKELGTVRNLLAEKYGKEFVLAAQENTDAKVNPQVVKKLSVEPPRDELVAGYLEEIARAYGVDWPKREAVTPPPVELLDTDDFNDDDGADDDAGGKEQKILADPLMPEQKSIGTPLKKLGPVAPTSPVTVTPPRMTTDNVHPKVTLGSVELKPNKKMDAAAAKKKTGPEGDVPDIKDLEARFAALKRGR